MKNKKKGFTIVELVIVIAVIGILAAVLIPTFVSLTNKANQAADQSLVKNLNTALATQEGLPEDKKNNTLHDAVLDLDAYGYKLENLAPKSDKEFVWDRNTNRFVFVSEVPEGKEYDYFKIQNSIEINQKFSVYAGKDFDATSVELNGFGFDAGGNDNIATVSYANTNEKEVVIRTNSASTTLTVNAPSDDVHHYGALGALNIVKAKTASYHENGKVAYVEIAYGRIVLERGADVEEIHINKKENEQAFDTVIIANNGGAEELPERITRDAVTVSEQKLVVTVESNGSSEQVYVYASGASGTTEKVTEGENKQNEAVNSALGQLVLDNGSAGEKAQTAEQKAEAKRETVNEAIENTEYKGVAISKAGESTQLMTLEAFRDAVNAGNTYAGYTVKLLDNINLENVEWTPLKLFKGTFDGNNYNL